MRHLERFLLSKRLIIAEMILVIVAMLLEYFVPQGGPAPTTIWGQAAHLAGFDRVLTSWWLYVLVALISCSLAAATLRFGRLAAQRTFRADPPASRGERVPDLDQAIGVMRKAGYLRMAAPERMVRLVKHPWGYWGGVILHAGMLLTLLSAVLFVLTNSSGTAAVMIGSPLKPGASWDVQQPSVLFGPLRLPFSVNVTQVRDTYWSNYDLKQLATTARIDAPGAPSRVLNVWINGVGNEHGISVYQGTKYGRAFLVEFSAGGQTFKRALLLPQPASPTAAGYGDYTLPGSTTVLRAKYFASRAKDAMTSDDPLLVLRLQSNGHPSGQIELTRGASATLGPYKVTLVGITPWVELVFVNHRGVAGVFVGFFVILLGSLLLYFAPPREAWFVATDDGWNLVWRSHRFAYMFDAEKKRLTELMIDPVQEDL